MLFVVIPRALIALASDKLEESKCGDPDFISGLEILDIAEWSPFYRADARDIAADEATRRCTPIYGTCAELKDRVHLRREAAYSAQVATVYAKYEAELRAVTTLEAQQIVFARRDEEKAAIAVPSRDDWKSYVLPAERQELCARIGVAQAWLHHANADTLFICLDCGLAR